LEGPTSPLFTEGVLARSAALFDEAEKRVAGKPAALHRVRVARLPILYVQVARLREKMRKPEGRTAANSRRLQDLFERFDAAARKEGVTHVGEQRGYPRWAQEVKSLLAPRGK
jgi:hypothetical protein